MRTLRFISFFIGCLCSVSGASWAVVGGKFVPFGEFEEVVLIEDVFGAHCSGVLISPSRVLTAAHCLDVEVERVVFANGKFAKPRYTARHPSYSTYEDLHSNQIVSEKKIVDVGLIVLGEYASILNFAQPLTLEELEALKLKKDDSATLVGFGEDKEKKHRTIKMKSTPQEIQQAVRLEFSKGIEGGDSGGAVFVDFDGRRRLLGLAGASKMHEFLGVVRWAGNSSYVTPIAQAIHWLNEERLRYANPIQPDTRALARQIEYLGSKKTLTSQLLKTQREEFEEEELSNKICDPEVFENRSWIDPRLHGVWESQDEDKVRIEIFDNSVSVEDGVFKAWTCAYVSDLDYLVIDLRPEGYETHRIEYQKLGEDEMLLNHGLISQEKIGNRIHIKTDPSTQAVYTKIK